MLPKQPAAGKESGQAGFFLMKNYVIRYIRKFTVQLFGHNRLSPDFHKALPDLTIVVIVSKSVSVN